MKKHMIYWVPAASLREMEPWLPPANEAQYLPILMEKTEIEHKDGNVQLPLEFSHFGLLGGIVVAYCHDRAYPDMELARPYLKKVLYLLREGYEQWSMEELLLNATHLIRTDYGITVSRQALRTGMWLQPDSFKIKNDYIIDTWCMAESGVAGDLKELFKEIINIFAEIRLEDLNPDAKQIILYIYCVALSYLGRREEARAFLETTRAQILNGELLDKLERLMCSDKVDLSELTIYLSGE